MIAAASGQIEVVPVEVVRDGQRLTLDIELGKWSNLSSAGGISTRGCPRSIPGVGAGTAPRPRLLRQSKALWIVRGVSDHD